MVLKNIFYLIGLICLGVAIMQIQGTTKLLLSQLYLPSTSVIKQ